MKKPDFLIGCNYWASNAGALMWRHFDPQIVEKDIGALSNYGVNCIRIFPNWEDFQPIKKAHKPNTEYNKLSPFLIRTEERPLLYEKFPESGLSERQVENFKFLLETAKKHNVKVIVAFITGWMSGRLFLPEALNGMNLISDPEAILWQRAFIKDMISEIKHYDNIIAWELGNECNCLDYQVNEKETELWISSIESAIRLADDTRPVYSGMHGARVQGPWNLLVQSKYLDMMTTHPYPAFTNYCGIEHIREMRASLHSAAETAYYAAIARKPCLVEEIGTLGPVYLSDEYAGEYFERALFTSLAVGTPGFLWWCAFEQNGLNFAPYDTVTLEQNLGLMYRNHQPKPVIKKLKEVSADLKEIGALPTPQADAVAVLAHATDQWKTAYGAFMLGVQSGRFVDYSYEEQILKNSDYYILPCIRGASALASFVIDTLKERVLNGAKLLITNAGGFISGFEELTGLKVYGRESVSCKKSFTIGKRSFEIACGSKLLTTAGKAKVLIKDDNGDILLSENKFGKGKVLFFNAPLEDFYSESYKPEDSGLHEIYNIFFAEKEKIFAVESDRCMVTTHELEEGKLAVMLNNYDNNVCLKFRLKDGYQIVKSLHVETSGDELTFKKKYAYFEIEKR
jgi:endo-1,4-beta-mannosidase